MIIPCPECGHKHVAIIDTRQLREGVSRKLKCKKCFHVFRAMVVYKVDYERLLLAQKILEDAMSKYKC